MILYGGNAFWDSALLLLNSANANAWFIEIKWLWQGFVDLLAQHFDSGLVF